jgi:hypothetical protein
MPLEFYISIAYFVGSAIGFAAGWIWCDEKAKKEKKR